jgi:putative DeoR family transcriptional regulator (stage III sporulation protein D)
MIYTHDGKERCTILGAYIIENRSTVRATAAYFGISKSTVHKDLTRILPGINKAMFAEVKDILDKNKSERHLRGGEATRIKYKGKNTNSGLKQGKRI